MSLTDPDHELLNNVGRPRLSWRRPGKTHIAITVTIRNPASGARGNLTWWVARSDPYDMEMTLEQTINHDRHLILPLTAELHKARNGDQSIADAANRLILMGHELIPGWCDWAAIDLLERQGVQGIIRVTQRAEL